MRVVIRAAPQVLAHVPSLVRYGSKPSREKVLENPAFRGALRTFEQAVNYAPHQAYLGAMHPREMPGRPWYNTPPPSPLSASSPHPLSPSPFRGGGTTPDLRFPSPEGRGDQRGEGRFGPDGEIMPEEEFLGLLAAVG